MKKALFLSLLLFFICGCPPRNISVTQRQEPLRKSAEVLKNGEACLISTVDTLNIESFDKDSFKTELVGKIPIPKFPIEVKGNYADESEAKFKLIFTKSTENWEKKVAAVLKIAKCIEATAKEYYSTQEFKDLGPAEKSEYKKTTQTMVQSARLRAIELTLKEHQPPIDSPQEIKEKIATLKSEVKKVVKNESSEIVAILDSWLSE